MGVASPCIDTVIFDAAGVIFEPSWLLSAANVDGSASTHHAIVAAFQSTYHHGAHPMSDWERGILTFEQFKTAMARDDVATKINWRTLQMRIDPPTIFAATQALMSDLKAGGYRVGVITNTMHEFTASNLLTDLQGLTDVWLRSCDVGYRKPEPAIFAMSLRQLGSVAESSLFLDDSAVCIAGAEAVGLRALLVADVEPAMASVRDLLKL